MSDVELVSLDRDHPGFRDARYRTRRQEIARLALRHRPGEACEAVSYTREEQDVWRQVLQKLELLHQRYACAEFLEAWPHLGFTPSEIPQFVPLNERLSKITSFQFMPVAGLVTPRVFLEALSRNVFLATQYMRHHSAPFYTPEPDVIHELLGHAALLAHPRLARLHRLFGEAALSADEPRLKALIRVYWYALEFGLLKSPSGLSVLGAGLLSSVGELGSLEKHPGLRPFELHAVAETDFDPTDYQKVLFVAESSEALFQTLEAWLSPPT